jgi:RimJ/RimL family protein N-acetyltransferase
VALARLQTEHFAAITTWDDTPEQLFTWAGPAFSFPLDATQLQRYAEESAACNRTLFAFLDPGAGALAGHVGLSDVDHSNGCAYIVRAVIDPSRRGEGLGTAMFSDVLGHAFAELGLHRVEMRVFGSNAAMQRRAEALGFEREGVLRDVRRVNGRFEDFVVFSMLDHEWKP